jgi:hypothetical protein
MFFIQTPSFIDSLVTESPVGRLMAALSKVIINLSIMQQMFTIFYHVCAASA